MKQSNAKLAKALTYSGTLPLVASAICSYFPVQGFDSALIARTYSAIIISFLCGIHWASYLFFSDKSPRNLLITSNAIALLAWGLLVLAQQPLATLLHVLCFLYLLLLDIKLYHAKILPEWFYHLRRNATIIVICCLGIFAGHP
jgi:hypothetical protein